MNRHDLDLLQAKLDAIDAKLDTVLELLEEKQKHEAVTEWHRSTVVLPYEFDDGTAGSVRVT